MVPEPPAGCEHVYLYGPDGPFDRSRPAGYWACDGAPEGASGPVYRVAGVACNCEFAHPLCADGTPDDCNGQVCDPGQSCVDYFGNGYCGCQGQCREDADCGRGEVCLCASSNGTIELTSINHCVPADCAVERDCAGDLRCKVSRGDCGSVESVRCTTPADDCVSDDDCSPQYCAWDEVEELWTCDPGAICE